MREDRAKVSFLERLLGWFGRLHPLIAHSGPRSLGANGRPFPAVQFLVVAGDIFGPLAAAADRLNGMSAQPYPILAYPR